MRHSGLTGATDPKPDHPACCAGIAVLSACVPELCVLRAVYSRGYGEARPDAQEGRAALQDVKGRSEEHTSELKSLMRISYAVFCLNKNIINVIIIRNDQIDVHTHINKYPL